VAQARAVIAERWIHLCPTLRALQAKNCDSWLA